jgi:hypothetical protein
VSCFAVVVVLAFIVCWLPFHVGRIIYINTEDSRTMYFSQYFNIVALQLFYLRASRIGILDCLSQGNPPQFSTTLFPRSIEQLSVKCCWQDSPG